MRISVISDDSCVRVFCDVQPDDESILTARGSDALESLARTIAVLKGDDWFLAAVNVAAAGLVIVPAFDKPLSDDDCCASLSAIVGATWDAISTAGLEVQTDDLPAMPW